MQIKLAWADIDAQAKRNVRDVLKSGWVSAHKYMPEFESKVAALHGCKYGVMVNSGTDALRIALATLKEVYQWKDGAEILVPAVTFVATVNVVLQTRLKPVFVDVERFTYNMNPTLISKAISKNTVGIIPVHLFGLPCDMKRISWVASQHGLKIIEDSCESMFVHKITGDFGCFSTYMAHIIQTGVGGVLTTNSRRNYDIARSYMNHGRDKDTTKYRFERVGYSSRATEFEAALGCAQLERREKILKRRQNFAWQLWKALPGEPFLQMPIITKPSSWMFFPMILLKGDRDKFMRHLLRHGVESRQMMPLINQPPYKDMVRPGEFPVAEWINRQGLCLPCHQKLDENDFAHMLDAIYAFFK